MNGWEFLSRHSDGLYHLAKGIFIVGVVGLLHHLIAMRCSALIDAWAHRNGWRVVARQRRFMRIGPFFFAPGQPVYRVIFENSLQRRREAFVRVGHHVMSVLSDEVDVEWTGPASPTSLVAGQNQQ